MVLIKRIFLGLSLSVVMGCGKGLNPGTSSSSSSRPAYRMIVVTANSLSGTSLGSSEADALTTLDNFCASEVGAGYKAMVSSATRNVTTNWVLTANTEYRRDDGVTVITTTNSSGTFDFPLTNSISSSFAYAWTGLNADWTTGSYNCSNWTGSGNGQYGQVDETNAWAISYTQYMCAANYHVYCVEQ